MKGDGEEERGGGGRAAERGRSRKESPREERGQWVQPRAARMSGQRVSRSICRIVVVRPDRRKRPKQRRGQKGAVRIPHSTKTNVPCQHHTHPTPPRAPRVTTQAHRTPHSINKRGNRSQQSSAHSPPPAAALRRKNSRPRPCQWPSASTPPPAATPPPSAVPPPPPSLPPTPQTPP